MSHFANAFRNGDACIATQGALPPGTRLHEFEILNLLGMGGFGIVYLAHDHVLNRQVAIKEYLPNHLAVRGHGQSIQLRSMRHDELFQKGLQGFICEARLLAQFDHPALVKVYRFWQANETAYLVMPYYNGSTLKNFRQTQTNTHPSEFWIRSILTPVLEALALLHGQNCLHRDISPDNIILVEGQAVLLDFGAARQLADEDTQQILTVIVKPGYAPIEQYDNNSSNGQGAWTDIYAIGALIYFLIKGKPPPPSIGRVQENEKDWFDPTERACYSPSLLATAHTCLALHHESRPVSIAAVQSLLLPVAYTGTSNHTGDIPGYNNSTHRPLKNKVTIWSGSLVMVVVLSFFISTKPITDHQQTPPQKPIHSNQQQNSSKAQTEWQMALQMADPHHNPNLKQPIQSIQVNKTPLQFTLESPVDGWIYLMLWDKSTEEIHLIFPNQTDANNQIQATVPFNFPRENWQYHADTSGVTWELLVLVLHEPLDLQHWPWHKNHIMRSIDLKTQTGFLPLFKMDRCKNIPSCQPPPYGALTFKVQTVD